jgi:hypothetical protein
MDCVPLNYFTTEVPHRAIVTPVMEVPGGYSDPLEKEVPGLKLLL